MHVGRFASPASLRGKSGTRLPLQPRRPGAWTTASAPQIDKRIPIPIYGVRNGSLFRPGRRAAPKPPRPNSQDPIARYSFFEYPSIAPVYLQRIPGSPPSKPSPVTITASTAEAPPAPPEQETPGIKKQSQESWAWGGKTLRIASQNPLSRDWRVSESDGLLGQSTLFTILKPALPPCRPPIRKRNRVSARFRREPAVGRAAFRCRALFPGVSESRGDMSDTGGDRARLRRYPKLPVWVVEDHQEVSRRHKPPSPGRTDSNPGSLQRLDLTLAAACPHPHSPPPPSTSSPYGLTRGLSTT